MTKKIVIKESALARKLFSESGYWSLLWLVLRIWLGWEWLLAGWGKLSGSEQWGPQAVLGFWQRQILIPVLSARPAITYDWYRSFLELLLSVHGEFWMAPLVAWGELFVGLALIIGAFVGIAAAAGAFMNMNYLLASVVSTNPLMLLIAIFLILAWKTAGWYGLDRWLLPYLGVPWAEVKIEE